MMAIQANPVPCLLCEKGTWPAWIVQHASVASVLGTQEVTVWKTVTAHSNQHWGMLLKQVHPAAGMLKQ